MKRRALVALMLALFLGSAAFSQTPVNPRDQKAKQALIQLFKELRDWAQSEIIPKMKDWKTKLDNSMSSEDLSVLNKLRDEATQLKQKGKRYAAALKTATNNNNAANVRLIKAKIKELVAQRDALLKDLKPLGTRYKPTLEEIGKDAKTYAGIWKEDIKKLVTTWYADHQSDLTMGYRRVFAKGLERLKALAGIDPTLRAKISAARFMLWDGKDLPDVSEMINEETLDPQAEATQVPEGYSLEANYPNPFNPSTNITFSIPQAQHVSLTVHDALGREVATLVDADLGAGSHTVTFDAKNFASGVYVYRIRAGDFVQEKKMQLVK